MTLSICLFLSDQRFPKPEDIKAAIIETLTEPSYIHIWGVGTNESLAFLLKKNYLTEKLIVKIVADTFSVAHPVN